MWHKINRRGSNDTGFDITVSSLTCNLEFWDLIFQNRISRSETNDERNKLAGIESTRGISKHLVSDIPFAEEKSQQPSDGDEKLKYNKMNRAKIIWICWSKKIKITIILLWYSNSKNKYNNQFIYRLKKSIKYEINIFKISKFI